MPACDIPRSLSHRLGEPAMAHLVNLFNGERREVTNLEMRGSHLGVCALAVTHIYSDAQAYPPRAPFCFVL